jgi:hypothetical protein
VAQLMREGSELHTPGNPPKKGFSAMFYSRLVKQKKLCLARKTPGKGTNSTVVMRPAFGASPPGIDSHLLTA